MKGLRLKKIALLIACIAVLLACSDENENESESCSYSVCDIRDHECAEDVARAVACHMDASLSLPTISYRSREELSAEFEASQAELTDEEKMIEWAFHERSQLLGFEPEGYTEEDSYSDFLDSLTAFYDRSAKEIVILNGVAGDLVEKYRILVHELVHAVQDQTWGLESLDEQHGYTQDRFFGMRSLTEGEATLYEILADAELWDISTERVDWSPQTGCRSH